MPKTYMKNITKKWAYEKQWRRLTKQQASTLKFRQVHFARENSYESDLRFFTRCTLTFQQVLFLHLFSKSRKQQNNVWNQAQKERKKAFEVELKIRHNKESKKIKKWCPKPPPNGSKMESKSEC